MSKTTEAIDVVGQTEQSPKVPSWVRPGQWFQTTADKYICYKIVEVDNIFAHTSDGGRFYLEGFTLPSEELYPVQIRPFRLRELELDMLQERRIMIDGKIVTLVALSRKRHEDATVTCDDGSIYSAEYLAKYGVIAEYHDVDDWQPCGLVLPMPMPR